MEDNQTSVHIRQKRQVIMRERRRRRIRAIAWYGLLAEVFLLPLSPGAATAALLIASIATGLRLWKDEEFYFRHLPFDVPAVLFVVISALSVLASPNRAFSFYNYYNLVGVYVLTYLLVGQNVRQPQQMKTILRVAGVSAVLVILYGYYQFLFGIDISSMKWVDGDAFPELRKRVFSTWENPNILAGYLDIVICLAFGLFMHASTKKTRMMFGGFMLAAAACLAMTYARGACLVIAVILAGYGALKDRRVLLACVIVGALLLAVDPVLYERLTSVFTKVDTSTEMRLAFWESTVAMIQDHPFLGIGWGAYWMVYPEYDFYLQGADILIVHAHNIYLNYMAEIGIPGAVTFFWFFFGTMFLALHQPFGGREKEGERHLLRGLSLGLGLAVLSVALNGLTDDLLFNIPSSMVLWMMAALTGALSFLSQPAANEEKQALPFGLDEEKLRAISARVSSLWQAHGPSTEESVAEKDANSENTTAPESKTEAVLEKAEAPKERADKKPAADGHVTISAEDIAAIIKEASVKEASVKQDDAQETAATQASETADGDADDADDVAAQAEKKAITDAVDTAEAKAADDLPEVEEAPDQAETVPVLEASEDAEEAEKPAPDIPQDAGKAPVPDEQADAPETKQKEDAHEGTDKHIQGDH